MTAPRPGEELHALLESAREHAGRQITIYSAEDRAELFRQAAAHRREAERLERQANGYQDGAA